MKNRHLFRHILQLVGSIALAIATSQAAPDASSQTGKGFQDRATSANLSANRAVVGVSIFEWEMDGKTVTGIGSVNVADNDTGKLNIPSNAVYHTVLSNGRDLDPAFWGTPQAIKEWNEGVLVDTADEGVEIANIEVGDGHDSSVHSSLGVSGTTLTPQAVLTRAAALVGVLFVVVLMPLKFIEYNRRAAHWRSGTFRIRSVGSRSQQ